MHKGIAFSQALPSTSDVRNLQAAGISIVRLEAGPDWGGAPVDYLRHAGIEVVLLLGAALMGAVAQDSWNLDASTPAFHGVQYAWQQAVRQVFRAGTPPRYVELWNEANCWTTPPFQRGGPPTGRTYIRPENYILLLTDAAQIIREVAPDTEIVSSGLFGHEASGVDYLKIVRQWTNGPEEWPVDYCGFHPYFDIAGGLQTNKLAAALQELHAVGERPILITETGWSTKLCTPALQAANIRDLLATCKASGIVEGVCVFAYQDSPGAVPPVFYGTYNRPAWEVIHHA